MTDVPQLPAETAGALASSVEDILRQGAAVATGGQGDYIKNADPESVYGKVQLATARQYCRAYVDAGDTYPDRLRPVAEYACRPYLDDIGYGTAPVNTSDQQGGGCPVAYSVSYETRNRTSRSINCSAFGDWGAVTTLIPSFPPPQGPIGPVEKLTGPFVGVPFADSSLQFRLTAANGDYFLNLGGSAGSAFFSGCGESYEYRNLVFTRIDGMPDQCDPIPPVITDPTPPPGPTPGPIQPFDPGDGTNVQIKVVLNIDGTVNIDYGTGPTTIDPFGGGGGGGGGGSSPGTAGGDESTGDGGEASGEAPPGEELVGLLVEAITVAGSPNRFDNNSLVVYRGIGYVRMGYPGRLGNDTSAAAAALPQFFHAQQAGLTAWAVSANIGFNLRVTPYYREVV